MAVSESTQWTRCFPCVLPMPDSTPQSGPVVLQYDLFFFLFQLAFWAARVWISQPMQVSGALVKRCVAREGLSGGGEPSGWLVGWLLMVGLQRGNQSFIFFSLFFFSFFFLFPCLLLHLLSFFGAPIFIGELQHWCVCLVERERACGLHWGFGSLLSPPPRLLLPSLCFVSFFLFCLFAFLLKACQEAMGLVQKSRCFSRTWHQDCNSLARSIADA